MDNLAKNEKVQTLATIGGLLGLTALAINVIRSPVTLKFLAGIKSKVTN